MIAAQTFLLGAVSCEPGQWSGDLPCMSFTTVPAGVHPCVHVVSDVSTNAIQIQVMFSFLTPFLQAPSLANRNPAATHVLLGYGEAPNFQQRQGLDGLASILPHNEVGALVPSPPLTYVCHRAMCRSQQPQHAQRHHLFSGFVSLPILVVQCKKMHLSQDFNVGKGHPPRACAPPFPTPMEVSICDCDLACH